MNSFTHPPATIKRRPLSDSPSVKEEDFPSAIETSANPGGGSSGGGSSRRAPRGAACLNCRRRKMRCDGGRPVCGQCVRTNREDDCEYTDGPGPSPTQVLEEQISRLESRIRELEHPELVVPSVRLNPTHAAGPQGLLSPFVLGSAPRPILSQLGMSESMPLAMSGRQGGPTPPLSQDPLVEPPADLVRNLVNAFLPHGNSHSFFLHVPRFMQAMQVPPGDHRRAQLSPALVNAVYLWGAHLSTSNAIRSYEETFLARATNALSTALRDSHYTVMNLIQAEVLVANYFFTMSRFLEGRYHCSAAVALTLSCRLHKIRSSADQGFGHGQPQGPQASLLPPPRDAIEEGERIRAFWFVYALDKSWAVALGSTSHFNGIAQSGTHVDTPWPLEMSQYEAGAMPRDFRSALTVYNFVAGVPSMPVPGRDSQLSLRAKAATLFEKASYLASQWSSTMNDPNEFYTSFMALDNAIDRFTGSLPPVDRAANPDTALTSLVTHTLARVATIQLRSSFKEYDRMNDRKDFTAAQAAVALLDQFNMAFANVDPILAILWTAVCRVLIAAAGSSASRTSQRDAVRAMADRVLGAMNRFRDTSPLMAAQYAEMRRRLE